MEQPSDQTKVSSVQTIPDLSPDGLALVLFFMCFILLLLGVHLMVKLIMKWRYFQQFIVLFEIIDLFIGKRKAACLRPLFEKL